MEPHKIQLIRQKLALDIRNIENGWLRVGQIMGVTPKALQNTLTTGSRRPRLATLTRIKAAIEQVKKEEEKEVERLLA